MDERLAVSFESEKAGGRDHQRRTGHGKDDETYPPQVSSMVW